ncbi:serine hydrolase-like protein isoform X2 [Onthophagus taurus]|uniref:serine hydrolase-like protein isoform X2 n=1 Tax=Onthophagus taurus TaxID=166361 RepID=UPI0039BE18EF
MKIEELRIPAPWGHIAVKTWGNHDDPTIIAIHGTGDNAATFDGLIPLLPKTFHYACIELPGHGKSTPFPRGILLYFEYILYSVKISMDYFKKNTYILMGHGLGAALCTFSAQMYPEFVSKLILIDALTSWPVHPIVFGKHLTESIRNTIQGANNNTENIYSYEEAEKILKNSKREGKLLPETCNKLLERMLTKVGENKYLFSWDERLARMLYPTFHIEDTKQFLETMPVRADTVFINFTGTSSRYSDYKDKTWNLFRVRKHYIKGDHYCIFTNPEAISKILNEFLLKEKSKL